MRKLEFSGPVLLRGQRPDLAGLPFRMGADCHLGTEATADLQVLSRKLRSHLQAAMPNDGVDSRLNAGALRQRLFAGADSSNPWLQSEAVATLVQMLQPESKRVRLLLVDILARIAGGKATAALATRAMVDLDAEVRAAAVRALADRPPEDYRGRLLDGLRYPWAPVADHAAEALVAVNDHDAVADLLALVDEPAPGAPVPVKKEGLPTYVREIVRVNHAGNCMLCHAPSLSQNDMVRAAVPDRRQSLPPPTSSQYYDQGGTFVRADITYLRQDFSVMQPVANPGPWPGHQRFDYMVRVRPATKLEIHLGHARKGQTYPQREAVLFALQELGGDISDLALMAPGTAKR